MHENLDKVKLVTSQKILFKSENGLSILTMMGEEIHPKNGNGLLATENSHTLIGILIFQKQIAVMIMLS
jgi:hypothetical protein